MAQNKEPNKEKLFTLEDMETQFVSMVNAGANRQTKFMVVKMDGELAKAVPAADAAPEDKRAAQEARAKQYGIEVLDTGAALSYPAGAPTTEALYGDPVNLKYPLGQTDNQADPARIRNALARFAQNYEVYSEHASHARIWERIVRAAMDAGIEHQIDPESHLDSLLPAGMRDELTMGYKEPRKKEEKNDTDGESPADASDADRPNGASDADFLALLDKAGQLVANRLIDMKIEATLQQPASAPAVAPEPEPTQKSAENGTRSDAHSDDEIAAMREQLAVMAKRQQELEAAVRKSKEEARRSRAAAERLRTSVGKASAMSYGEIDGSVPRTEAPKPLWGVDLAAEASRDQ